MELLSRLKGRATNLYCRRGRHNDISVGAINRLRDRVYTNFNSIALYISAHEFSRGRTRPGKCCVLPVGHVVLSSIAATRAGIPARTGRPARFNVISIKYNISN